LIRRPYAYHVAALGLKIRRGRDAELITIDIDQRIVRH